MLSQFLRGSLPADHITQVPEHNRQAVVCKIRFTDVQSGDLFQRAVRLPHPVPHGHFAMVALRDNVGQPDAGRPAPTQSLL